MSHRVAIVGAGPSGFYAADGLLRGDSTIKIDLIDRLPTPFGLVRAGVAPDHQGTKAVARQFDRLLAQPNVRFCGGIEIGNIIDRSRDRFVPGRLRFADAAAASVRGVEFSTQKSSGTETAFSN